MIRDARRRKLPQTNEEQMLRAAAIYLTERGYAVATISADRIQSCEGKAGFEFVVRFGVLSPPVIEEPAKP